MTKWCSDKKLNSEKEARKTDDNFQNSNAMATTYTLTDLQGNETTFAADHVWDFIRRFGEATGHDFSKTDLYWNDERLTSSLRFMEEHIGEATELLMVVSDKPIRVMDCDIADIENSLSELERHNGLWHSRSQELEDMYGPVEDWDVSFVGDMTGWFATELCYETMWHSPTDVTLFNRDISKWDVSSVEVFDDMFYANTLFDCDISEWDVSAALSTDNMFMRATGFKQDITPWVAKLSKEYLIDTMWG